MIKTFFKSLSTIIFPSWDIESYELAKSFSIPMQTISQGSDEHITILIIQYLYSIFIAMYVMNILNKYCLLILWLRFFDKYHIISAC